MVATLVVETGSGDTTSNAYITEASANAYFSNKLYADRWEVALSQQRIRAIITATKTLDDFITWKGYRVSENQALAWPRAQVNDQDGYLINNATVPQAVKDATCELAILLLDEDRREEDDMEGITKIAVGPISIERDKNEKPIIPDHVARIIRFIGSRASDIFEVTKLRT